MKQFPVALRCYLVTMGLAGAAAVGGSWFLWFDRRSVSLLVVAVLTGLLILFQTSPRHKIRGAKITLSTVAVFAAVIALPVGPAVGVATVGMVAAEFLGRRPWYEALFNGATAGLQACAAGSLYAVLGAGHAVGLALAAAGISAIAIYLASVSAVAGAVAAQHRLSYFGVWRQMVMADVRSHVVMYTGGGLLAGLLNWNLMGSMVILAIGLLLYLPNRLQGPRFCCG